MDLSPCTLHASRRALQVLLGVLGAVLVLWWLITGSMLLNNVLGIAFCCAFISFVRLPNIRVGGWVWHRGCLDICKNGQRSGHAATHGFCCGVRCGGGLGELTSDAGCWRDEVQQTSRRVALAYETTPQPQPPTHNLPRRCARCCCQGSLCMISSGCSCLSASSALM